MKPAYNPKPVYDSKPVYNSKQVYNKLPVEEKISLLNNQKIVEKDPSKTDNNYEDWDEDL